MSRVWKRTLYKLGKGVLFVLGAIAYAVLGIYIGERFLGSKEGGFFGLYAAGVTAWIIHTVYQDAKREIQYENDKLMLQLKKDEIINRFDKK